METTIQIKKQSEASKTTLKFLLACGIISSLLYVAANIIVPPFYSGYDPASQTVSELSAIGAPTRILWAILVTPYILLMIAFSIGVWKSAVGNRSLRVIGGLLIVYSFLGLIWPFAPMHLRETIAAGGSTLSDTVHIALGAVTEVLFLSALGFSTVAFGKGFRIYSILTFVVLLVFGILTFIDAPNLSANKPTPFMGVWERINIGMFLLWIAVLAVILLRKERAKSMEIPTQSS
jgi:phosphotransferase system  glucose/maltose/N-acetylglucosamine-specific IIC component